MARTRHKISKECGTLVRAARRDDELWSCAEKRAGARWPWSCQQSARAASQAHNARLDWQTERQTERAAQSGRIVSLGQAKGSEYLPLTAKGL